MQIIVLGMHRSGTSAVTRLINMMGAYFGPEKSSLGFNDENPKGFWERSDVVKLNQDLLKSRGCSWHNLKQWVFKDIKAVSEDMSQSLKKLVLDMDAFRPFVLKDPRLCLLLPAWRQFLESPVVVTVYRDPLEIALSLEKRNKLPLEFGLALWEYYAVGALNASRGMPRIIVNHSDIINRPVEAVAQLYGMLCAYEVKGLHMPSPREIQGFIDTGLHRAQLTEKPSVKLTPEQRKLKRRMQNAKPPAKPLVVSEAAQKIMADMADKFKLPG